MQQKNWMSIAGELSETPVRSMHAGKKWALSIAATSILAIAAWFVWQSLQKSEETNWMVFSTKYGEKRKVTLPDSTIVILNGHSTLKIPAIWNEQSSRTVWLEGEGYFEVTKGKSPEMAYFIVHTHSMDVKVLGTKFNIDAYDGASTISLKEGKVEVVYTNDKKTANKKEILQMKPGEVVTIAPESAPLLASTSTDIVADWISNEFHFEYTRLGEIGEMIYQRYGYSMKFSDSLLENRSVNGHLHAGNLDELLNALEITLNITIKKKNKELLVSVN
jgi:ferric-dicitrate binding protein FerR (iron transport regulator)